jgi:hypothetical protein
MATVEDVLNPFERNAWFYVDINGEDADYYYDYGDDDGDEYDY